MRLIADGWCLQLQWWNGTGCNGHWWRCGCGRVLIIILLLMIIGSGQAICGWQVWCYAAGRYGRRTGHVVSRQRCNVYWRRLLEETIVLGSSTFRLALLVQLKWKAEKWFYQMYESVRYLYSYNENVIYKFTKQNLFQLLHNMFLCRLKIIVCSPAFLLAIFWPSILVFKRDRQFLWYYKIGSKSVIDWKVFAPFLRITRF